MTTPNRDEVLAKIEKARQIVGEISAGTRGWTMSVPARPDSDPDLVIADALASARTLLSAAQAEAYPTGEVIGPCVCGSWPGGECFKCPRVVQSSSAQTDQTWTITAPDGRRWTGESALRAAAAAQRDTIDPVVAMQRINAAVEEERALNAAEHDQTWNEAIESSITTLHRIADQPLEDIIGAMQKLKRPSQAQEPGNIGDANYQIGCKCCGGMGCEACNFQQGAPVSGAIEGMRDKWKIVDGDCREGAEGLITHHVAAFDEGYSTALSQQPAAQTAAPVGWRLVPTEPTEEMHVAAVRTIIRCTGNDDFPPRVYRAMLSAAPQPVAAQQPAQSEDAGRVMMSAHAFCPTEMPHPDRMRWMAKYFIDHYATAQSEDARDAKLFRQMRAICCEEAGLTPEEFNVELAAAMQQENDK